MNKLLAVGAAALMALGWAGSASATVLLDTGGIAGLTQVHSTGSQGPAPTVYGVLQGSTTQLAVHGGSNLSVSGAGYAQFDGPFSTLEYYLTNYAGGFTATNFSLFADGVNGRTPVPAIADITVFDLNDNALKLFDNVSLKQGLNSFNITGDNSEVFSRITFSIYNSNANTTLRPIGDIRQIDLKLAPISAVPEPSTWAMLIVGFAGVGAMLRRTRRKDGLVAA